MLTCCVRTSTSCTPRCSSAAARTSVTNRPCVITVLLAASPPPSGSVNLGVGGGVVPPSQRGLSSAAAFLEPAINFECLQAVKDYFTLHDRLNVALSTNNVHVGEECVPLTAHVPILWTWRVGLCLSALPVETKGELVLLPVCNSLVLSFRKKKTLSYCRCLLKINMPPIVSLKVALCTCVCVCVPTNPSH